MRRIFFHLISVALLVLPSIPGHGAEPAQREPYGIGLEGFAYPYPVSMLPAGADGLYGCCIGAAERPHRGAAARPQFPVELLGACHQDTD